MRSVRAIFKGQFVTTCKGLRRKAVKCTVAELLFCILRHITSLRDLQGQKIAWPKVMALGILAEHSYSASQRCRKSTLSRSLTTTVKKEMLVEYVISGPRPRYHCQNQYTMGKVPGWQTGSLWRAEVALCHTAYDTRDISGRLQNKGLSHIRVIGWARH